MRFKEVDMKTGEEKPLPIVDTSQLIYGGVPK